MPEQRDLSIKIFADGADLEGIVELAQDPTIAGFTTNPTLMSQSGVTDYEGFARKVLEQITDRPISFEVFSDEPTEMARQARLIAVGRQRLREDPGDRHRGRELWPPHPLALRRRAPAQCDRRALAEPGGDRGRGPASQPRRHRLGVRRQDRRHRARPGAAHATGSGDPEALPGRGAALGQPAEILNVCQADAIGCHIITVTHDLLKKLRGLGP